MRHIKKLFLLILLTPFSVSASLTTNFGLELSTDEVEHFRNLGFVDEQLLFFDDELYNKYIGFEGLLAAQDIRYYKTIYYADNNYKYRSSLIDSMSIEPLSYTYEISKEEYDNSEMNKFTLMSDAESEPVNTNMKKMVTSLSYIPAKKQYFAMNYLHWKSLPKTRSRDIIAMSNNNSVTEPVNKTYDLELFVSRYNDCSMAGYSEKVNETKNASWTKTASGAAAIFNFPKDKYEHHRYDELTGKKYDCRNKKYKRGASGSFNSPIYVDGLDITLSYNLLKLIKQLLVYTVHLSTL